MVDLVFFVRMRISIFVSASIQAIKHDQDLLHENAIHNFAPTNSANADFTSHFQNLPCMNLYLTLHQEVE
jgi:hypothetical protein